MPEEGNIDNNGDDEHTRGSGSLRDSSDHDVDDDNHHRGISDANAHHQVISPSTEILERRDDLPALFFHRQNDEQWTAIEGG